MMRLNAHSLCFGFCLQSDGVGAVDRMLLGPESEARFAL
jgi:hypothetical protein